MSKTNSFKYTQLSGVKIIHSPNIIYFISNCQSFGLVQGTEIINNSKKRLIYHSKYLLFFCSKLYCKKRLKIRFLQKDFHLDWNATKSTFKNFSAKTSH